MKNSFNTENETRNAASRLGLEPQNKAKGNERKILHLWAVRPGKNAGNRVNHSNAPRFTPLRNARSNAHINSNSPFANMEKNDLKGEKGRRIVKLLGTWGPRARDAKILGEGVAGTVMSIPVAAARNALVKSTFNPITTLPSTGVVAAKFQLVKSSKDLANFVRETQIHSVALTPSGSALSKHVPKLYAAYYDPDARLHVTFMEMVKGKTLQSIIDSGDKLTDGEYRALARAFFELWKRGIFHSDAHGGNIFIDRGSNKNNNGGSKVTFIDFGQSEYLPLGLRPSTLAQAMDPVFQKRLETYVGSLKTGQNWFNPNTRTLKIAKALTVNKGRLRSNAFATAIGTPNITNRPRNNRTRMVISSGSTPSGNKRNNSATSSSRNNRSVFSNTGNESVGSSRVSVGGGSVSFGNKNVSTPNRTNANVRKTNSGAKKTSSRASPSARKSMINTVTKSYEKMLGDFVNKRKPVAFVKTA